MEVARDGRDTRRSVGGGRGPEMISCNIHLELMATASTYQQ